MSQKVKKLAKNEHLHSHAAHSKSLLRLKIASGHLQKVISMIEEDKKCVDVLQQLSAVISTLESSRIVLLQDHVNSCIAPELPGKSKHLIEELDVLLKRAFR